MNVGMEFEGLFHNELEVDAVGGVCYNVVKPVKGMDTGKYCNYWGIKTDSSINGDRPLGRYDTYSSVGHNFNNYYKVPNLTKQNGLCNSGYLKKLARDFTSILDRKHNPDNRLFENPDHNARLQDENKNLKEYYEKYRNNHHHYRPFEIVSLKANKHLWNNRDIGNILDPIHIDAVPRALEEFEKQVICLGEDELLWDKMLINESCGLHLRVGEPLRYEFQKVNLLNTRPLYKLKFRMTRWIEKNEGIEAAWMFASHIRRGQYSGPIDLPINCPTNTHRTEISLNKGLEWRAFHIVGVNDWEVVKRRIIGGLDILADAYSQCMHNNIYTGFTNITSTKKKLRLELTERCAI